MLTNFPPSASKIHISSLTLAIAFSVYKNVYPHYMKTNYDIDRSRILLTLRPFVTASMPDDSSPSLLSSGVGSDEFRRKLGIFSRGKARCFSDIVRCFVSVGSLRKATNSCSHSKPTANHLFLHSSAAKWINHKDLTRTLSTIWKERNVDFRAMESFTVIRLPLSLNRLTVSRYDRPRSKMQRWYFPNRIHFDIILIHSALACQKYNWISCK